LIELADRRQAAVVVLGDHGFGPFREKICVNEVLRRRGLQRLASRASTWRHRAARTAWKVRKWLHRRTQGGSTAGVRRPLEALAPVDWRRTAALAVHGELSALVYLNDTMRFGRGPLATPRQREQAEAEAMAAFRESRHPVTGEALFEGAYATRERFACDPMARGWPDVVAIPAPGFHTRSKFDARGQLLFADPTLTGTHRRETVLMIRAPWAAWGTRPGVAREVLRCAQKDRGTQKDAPPQDDSRATVEMRDVAPTILGLLGQPPGEHMTGHCITDRGAVPGGVEIHHDRAARPAARPVAAPGHAASSSPAGPEQRLVEDRLRDLGYLE
jgi:predicted AlkP superfamily phosphohydrolase/phosphomutase